MLMENESFEKWTLFLDPSQEKLVTMNLNGPMLIEGGPGTGKNLIIKRYDAVIIDEAQDLESVKLNVLYTML